MPLLVEMGDEDGQRMMEDITVGINGSSLPTYTKEVDGQAESFLNMSTENDNNEDLEEIKLDGNAKEQCIAVMEGCGEVYISLISSFLTYTLALCTNN